MLTEHRGLRELNGSLVILEGVQHPLNEELVRLKLDDGTERTGRIVAIEATRLRCRSLRVLAAFQWSIPGPF